MSRSRRTALAALAIAGATVLMGGGAASADDAAPVTDALRTTDALVTALKADPVVVHQTRGSGDTAGAYRRLSRLADQVRDRTGTAVYVALVNPPTDAISDDASADLGAALPRRIQQQGVYFVDASRGAAALTVRGTSIEQNRLYLAANSVEDQVSGDETGSLPPVLRAEVVLRLVLAQDPATMVDGPYGDDEEDRYGTLPAAQIADLRALLKRTAEPERDRDLSRSSRDGVPTGEYAVFGTTAGALVLLVVLTTLLRRWPATKGLRAHLRRRPTTGTPIDLDAVGAEVRDGLTSLASGIAAAPARPRHPDALERAVAARESAEHLVDSRDERELLGALTLVRAGLLDLRAATRRNDQPWRPCFLHPLHQAATTTTSLSLDDTDLDVPVCPACAKDLQHGRRLDAFRPRRVGRDRPYYEGDDVWASTGYGSLDPDYAHTVLRSRQARR